MRTACALLTMVSLFTIAAAAGCSREANALSGAVYGSQIPVYPGADYEDSMGAETYATIGGPPTGDRLTWFFKISDPADKIVAFYKEKVPQATREEGEDDDEIVLRFAPGGAEENESVTIRIRAGKLQISESVKAGKRKD